MLLVRRSCESSPAERASGWVRVACPTGHAARGHGTHRSGEVAQGLMAEHDLAYAPPALLRQRQRVALRIQQRAARASRPARARLAGRRPSARIVMRTVPPASVVDHAGRHRLLVEVRRAARHRSSTRGCLSPMAPRCCAESLALSTPFGRRRPARRRAADCRRRAAAAFCALQRAQLLQRVLERVGCPAPGSCVGFGWSGVVARASARRRRRPGARGAGSAARRRRRRAAPACGRHRALRRRLRRGRGRRGAAASAGARRRTGGGAGRGWPRPPAARAAAAGSAGRRRDRRLGRRRGRRRRRRGWRRRRRRRAGSVGVGLGARGRQVRRGHLGRRRRGRRGRVLRALHLGAWLDGELHRDRGLLGRGGAAVAASSQDQRSTDQPREAPAEMPRRRGGAQASSGQLALPAARGRADSRRRQRTWAPLAAGAGGRRRPCARPGPAAPPVCSASSATLVNPPWVIVRHHLHDPAIAQPLVAAHEDAPVRLALSAIACSLRDQARRAAARSPAGRSCPRRSPRPSAARCPG